MSTAAAAVVETEPPRLVFFYDERSGRSRRAEGFLAHVLQRRGNQKTFRILRVEVGQRPDLADRFAVTAAPTLLVVADRKVQARLECPRGCRDIEFLLRPWLRQASGKAEGTLASW
jgi:thioredoxin-like negative regulator of GroEL